MVSHAERIRRAAMAKLSASTEHASSVATRSQQLPAREAKATALKSLSGKQQKKPLSPPRTKIPGEDQVDKKRNAALEKLKLDKAAATRANNAAKTSPEQAEDAASAAAITNQTETPSKSNPNDGDNSQKTSPSRELRSRKTLEEESSPSRDLRSRKTDFSEVGNKPPPGSASDDSPSRNLRSRDSPPDHPSLKPKRMKLTLPPTIKKANLKDDDDSDYKSDPSVDEDDDQEVLSANDNVAALLLKVSRLESANAALRSQQNIRDSAIEGFHASHIDTDLHTRRKSIVDSISSSDVTYITGEVFRTYKFPSDKVCPFLQQRRKWPSLFCLPSIFFCLELECKACIRNIALYKYLH
jgi:hypothetical protein